MLSVERYFHCVNSLNHFLKSSACPLCRLIQRYETDHVKETFCDLSLHLPKSGDVLWSLAGRQQEPVERPVHVYSRLDHLDTCITHFSAE